MTPARKILPSLLTIFLLVSSFQLLASIRPTPSRAQLDDCTPDSTQVALCTAAGADEAACQALQCAIQKSDSRPTNTRWYNPTLLEFSKKVFDSSPDNEIFGERYTYAQVNWIVNSIFTLLLPKANNMNDVVELFKALNALRGSDLQQPQPSLPGHLQFFADIISFPFTHPVASAKSEAIGALANMNIVSPAYAQGVGYGKLTGSTGSLRILWTATRNMAYLISIILLIAAGFMVMFRSKVNPQAVVSVQMIIPKLVISLILITFSLAIVGFVIDMIYVAIAAFVGFLSVAGVSTDLAKNITTLTMANTNWIGQVFLWWYITLVIIIIIVMILLQNFVVQFGGFFYIVLGILLSLLIWAVISIVRIVITLFHAYLNLIILTITGPLRIMIDIIPNKENAGFWPWFKCVIGNASVFVVTAILVVFATVLFDFGGGTRDNLFFNIFGLDPNFSLPFVGNSSGNFGRAEWFLGDITRFGNKLPFGAGGAGWLLSNLFLPMAFFSAMPNVMVSVRNMFCKEQDPSQQITEAINNIVKQLTGGKAMTTQDKMKEQESLGLGQTKRVDIGFRPRQINTQDIKERLGI